MLCFYVLQLCTPESVELFVIAITNYTNLYCTLLEKQIRGILDPTKQNHHWIEWFLIAYGNEEEEGLEAQFVDLLQDNL